ncbi:hypothetical protein RND81_12G082300 [Saponaria officinalis]|uniref:RING-CH-type domain-containing protein n=1 Tax=Saponaria officinalis TaxID=3572 RepID=A0AAW1H7Z4_SAPOF
MVDDFMVCVDRIIASACLNPSNEVDLNSGIFHLVHNHSELPQIDRAKSFDFDINNNNNKINRICSSSCNEVVEKEVKECRICQEEDDDINLESPCACNGTLKFAHWKCIQKWCNKKGDITCEICNQVFAPNYSLPPPKSSSDVMAVDLRQAWGHYGYHDHNLLALAEAEHHLLESEYDDYEVAAAGNVTCLRSIAIILMFILMIHQVLMITRDFGLMEGYSTFFNFQVSVLQLAGFLLPCYVLARSWYILHTRRRRQG